jgi:SET domain-containing protein
MAVVSKRKPYRVARSRTGLGLFATREIEKGTRIVEYFGPLLDCRIPKMDAIENKYLFELDGRWTIDGSVRRNIARYANHSCRPNAESDVRPRLKKVFIRAIKTIKPGDEITYDYGTDYFREYLKPIGCKCPSCETKRKAARAEERAKKKRALARQKRALNGHGANGKALNGKAANGHAGNGHALANGVVRPKRSRRAVSVARH